MVKPDASLYIEGMSTIRFHAVLVAAGRSSRLGGPLAKPWIDLGGRTVIRHALEALSGHDAVAGGVIVASEDRLEDARSLAEATGWLVVEGGAERALSVHAGLEALAALDPQPQAVLIHDAARPFIPAAVIDRLATSLAGGARVAIPTLPPADSLKKVADSVVVARVDRDGIERVQTPQAFDFAALLTEHRQNSDVLITDDSTLMEDAGYPVATVTGDPVLAKITTAPDLDHAKIIARGLGKTEDTAMIETRTATGFDVHRFSSAPGPIRLGGIDIPHDHGFDAHSDGDVALHALTDAIYGLVADGDIGAHFPPSDDTWKDRDSAHFLDAACTRLHQDGGCLTFCDLTIIAETPKITPHREAIRARIAEITGLAVSRVSVKATTSEGLGFTGRGEGIAVQAAATAQFVTKAE
ncbi:MAG: 2-C-methyl-D-erythritol 4-phosphate cytidylyltransferase [Candidatus Puniceispirillales bacterium]